jgi:hypothetical protein
MKRILLCAVVVLVLFLFSGCSAPSFYEIINKSDSSAEVTVFYTDRFFKLKRHVLTKEGRDTFVNFSDDPSDINLNFQTGKGYFRIILPAERGLSLKIIGQPVIKNILESPEDQAGRKIAIRLQEIDKHIDEVELDDLFYSKISIKTNKGEETYTMTEFLKRSKCDAKVKYLNCKFFIK